MANLLGEKFQHWSRVHTAKDVDSYAGHVVAFASWSSYFRSGCTYVIKVHYSIEPRDKPIWDRHIFWRFGYIPSEIQTWPWGEQGYPLIRVLEKDDEKNNAVRALVTTLLGFQDGFFSLRDATPSEKNDIRQGIEKGQLRLGNIDSKAAAILFTPS